MIKIVYMGTPEIAVRSLEELISDKEIEVQSIVTQPDRPKGRGKKIAFPPIKDCALKHDLICYQTEKISKDKELLDELRKLKPDFLITFAFGQILSQEVLDIPKIATINLHASLLPKYRGANPIQRCIYNGDCKTGITTMLTVLELDAGDICETKEIDITENMTDIELKRIISEESPKLLCSTIKGLYEGKLKPKKQNNEDATIAKKFDKQDGLINWSKDAKAIHNMVRAMLEYPTAYTYIQNKMIKILESRIISEDNTGEIGRIASINKKGIEIQTGKGTLLITRVKPESKGEMNAYDYANGCKISAGMKIGD